MSKNRSRIKLWIYVFLVFAFVHFVTSFPHGNYSNARRRHRRAPGDTVDNFQALARISSGISLEIGLMDDTITPENAVAELLHYGPSIKTNDIIGLDKTAIDDAINSLETLGKTLKLDKAVTDIEDRLVFLQEIGSTFDTKNFSNFTGKKDYEAHLPKIEGLKSEQKRVGDLKQAVETVNRGFNSLEGWSKDPQEYGATMISSTFKTISLNFAHIEMEVGTLGTLFGKLKEGEGFSAKSSFFEQLKNENEIREKLAPRIDYSQIISVNFNTNEIFKARDKISSYQGSINVVHKLIETHSHPETLSPMYTSGFPNGKSDLEQLKNDCGNKWIHDRVNNGSLVKDSLQKAFTAFNGLIGDLNKVHEGWKHLGDASTQKLAQKVTGALFSISKLSGVSNTVHTTIKTLRNCPQMMLNVDPFKNIEDIWKEMDKLNQKVDRMLKFSSLLGYTKDLQNLKTFKDIFDKAEKMAGTKTNVLKNVISELNSESKFKQVTEDLKNFQIDLVELDGLLTDIPVLASKAIQDMQILKNYHESLNKPLHMEFFDCLKNVGQDGEVLRSAIEARREMDFNDKSLDAARQVVDDVSASKNHLKNAVNSATNFKTVEDPAVKNLKDSFTDKGKALEMSEKLGKAVQGLMAIQSAFIVKNNLNTLLTDIPTIIQTPPTLAKEHRDSLSHLSDLKKAFTKIEAFQKTLNDAKSLRKKRAADFKSFDNVFVSADQIPGFTEDIEKVQKALIALDPNKPYSTEMDALKTLDLDFKKFGILAGKDSLSVIDDFFLEYTKKMSEVKPVVNPKPNPNPGLSSLRPLPMTSSEATTPDGFDVKSLLSSAVFWAPFSCFCLIICLIILIIWLIKRKKEKERKKREEEERLMKLQREEEERRKREEEERLNKLKRRRDEPIETNEPKKKKTNAVAKRRQVEEMWLEVARDEIRQEEEARARKQTEQAEKLKEQAKELNEEANQKVKQAEDRLKHADRRVQTADAKRKEAEDQLEIAKKEPPKAPDPVKKVDSTSKPLDEFDAFKLCNSTVKELEHACYAKNENPEDWGRDRCDRKHQSPPFTENYTDHMCERRHFNDICCKEYRHVLKGFKDGFLHCNFIDFEVRWYLATGPLSGSEVINYKIRIRPVSTVVKFVAQLEQGDIGVVLKLCEFSEIDHNQCAPYFIERVDGFLRLENQFIVTTLGKKELDNLPHFIVDKEKYILWTISIFNIKTNITKQIDVLSYSGWSENSAPLDPKIGLEMISFLDSYKKNVLVHCSNGIGRTGTIAGIKYGLHVANTEPTKDIFDIINPIRRHRFGAIQCAAQATYIVLCVTKGLMDRLDINFLNAYNIILYFHRNLVQKRYEHFMEPKAGEAKEHFKNRKKTALFWERKSMEAETAQLRKVHIQEAIREEERRLFKEKEEKEKKEKEKKAKKVKKSKNSISLDSTEDVSRDTENGKSKKKSKRKAKKDKKSKGSKESQETAEEPTKNSEKGSKKTKRNKDQKRGEKSKEKSKEMTEETQKTEKSSKL